MPSTVREGGLGEGVFINGPPLRRDRIYRFDHSHQQLEGFAAVNPSEIVEVESRRSVTHGKEFDARTQDCRSVTHIPDGFHLVIPGELLTMICQAFGENTLDRRELNQARRLTELAKELQVVGFWRRRSIEYSLLEPRTPIDLHYGRSTFLDRKETQQRVATLDSRLDRINGYMRGYVGWLMSNRQFLDEQRELLRQFPDEVQANGFPTRSQCCGTSTNIVSGYLKRCADFYDMWILDSLTAPCLPIPVGPKIPNVMLSRNGGGDSTFTIPCYVPISGQGELAEMLDDARPSASMRPKLADWFAIIGKNEVSHNKIPGFARRLRLQRYWTALVATFPARFERAKKKLTSIFASFLAVGEDTIKQDVQILSRNLGSHWMSVGVDE